MSIERRKETAKLADMRTPEQNVRIHPEKQINELVRSLEQFGQCRDIVLDETGMILSGNGLKIAMERLGKTEANVIRLIGLSEKQKLKYMLADNKTFALGVEDLDGVNIVLAMLGDDLDVPGYDPATLEALVATAEEATDLIMNYGTIDESEIQDIQAKGERKEVLMEKYADGQEDAQASQSDSGSPESAVPAPDAAGDKAAVMRTVCCPHCGEEFKIE